MFSTKERRPYRSSPNSDSPKALDSRCLQPVRGLHTQTKELVLLLVLLSNTAAELFKVNLGGLHI